MKRVRRWNRALLIGALLLGLSLGGAAALLCLSFFGERPYLSFAGLICVLINAIIAFCLLFILHARDQAIAEMNVMNDRFGGEVPFLSEERFIKNCKKKNQKQIHALHLLLQNGVDERQTLNASYALAEALKDAFEDDGLIGYTSRGDFLFALSEGEDFLSRMQRVDEAMKQNKAIVPYILLLGQSGEAENIEEACEQALLATLQDEYSRTNLSLEVYDGAKETHDSLDLAYEMEQGRLRFALLPFGGDLPEAPLALFAPSLYDPYRGPLSDKDLFRALSLGDSLRGLDELAIEEVIRILSSETLPLLLLRLCEDSVLDPSFLPRLSEAFDNAGIDKTRLNLCLSCATLSYPNAVAFALKAKGLGYGLSVYDYDGENVASIIKTKPSYALIKPELLRKSASLEFLTEIVGLLPPLGVAPLIETGKLGDSLSALSSGQLQNCPRKEEEA